jgi:hypothetical protein
MKEKEVYISNLEREREREREKEMMVRGGER